MGNFKKSNKLFVQALADEVENIRDVYFELADQCGIGEDLDKLFRIGEWHRLKCLERREDCIEGYISDDEVTLLQEEWKLIIKNGEKLYLSEDRLSQIEEWNHASYDEKLVGFGIYVYMMFDCGGFDECQLLYLFRIACENIGYFSHRYLMNDLSLDDNEKALRSLIGKKSADALHNAPGGSREKRRSIQAIWKTGKYTDRDLCAEQECAALEMSFSTARKALRGISGFNLAAPSIG